MTTVLTKTKRRQRHHIDHATTTTTTTTTTSSGIIDDSENSTPFLTLEETAELEEESTILGIAAPTRSNSKDSDTKPLAESTSSSSSSSLWLWCTKVKASIVAIAASTRQQQQPRCKVSGKTIVSCIMFSLVGIVIWDALFTDPEKRLLKPDFSAKFLLWVQSHPTQGLFAFLVVIATAVVFMIPVGTPLTLGCGYIYKGAYGWKLGLAIATAVSMGGSALGAVVCFLLGRYLMRDKVRTWVKEYPIFDAIDVAASEHGLRIMAMLYLTPILPLGPVSYMCGTTSMALSSFVLAKIASLPLMLLYVFIGASTGALIGTDPQAAAEVKSIEENEGLIVSGILLSLIMITGITRYIRAELSKILERQEKHKPGEVGQGGDEETAAMETELTLAVTAPRLRRAA